MENYGTSRQATDGNIMLLMLFAYWILKATDKHSEYVIRIVCRQQQLLQEIASLLRHTYSVCVSSFISKHTGTLAHPNTGTMCVRGYLREVKAI